MLNRIRYALGEGKSSKHLSGEDMFSHEYDGGVANIIPRNEGKTLHVDYVGPKGASPGEAAHFNTLGPSKLRDMAKRLREMYPNSQFITGIRPTGKRVMRDITKLSRINSSNTEGLKYARSTPESIKKLEQAVLHSPNNPTLIHALADEYEENGRGNEAEMLRNPEFHHLVKDLTEREAGFGANHNAGERLNFSAATATPNPMLLAALAARMSKKRPVTASIISHGNDGPRDSLSVMRRGWYLNDASSVPLKGADFARHNNAPTPGRPARIAVRIGMPQHPMHYLNFSRDMTPEEADQTEQSLRAEGLHGHEDHEAPDAMIDVRKALGESEHKPVHMMGRSREGHHDLRRYQMVAGDFLQALQRIRSSDQRTVRKSMEEIAAKLGAKPASTVDALHDSPAYSVPGVAMAIYSNLSPEKIHALAAWGALTQNTPGNAVFHVRPDGPDMLHRFRMQGSGHELRARLDKAGLDSRILVPHKTGFDVMIPDKGGLLRNQVKGFTDQQKTELQTSRGHFKMIGSSDQARAREMFRDAITKQEQGPVRKSEGADNSPPPSIPQGPPAGPGAGADLPSQPVHRASRIRRIMERLKRV